MNRWALVLTLTCLAGIGCAGPERADETAEPPPIDEIDVRTVQSELTESIQAEPGVDRAQVAMEVLGAEEGGLKVGVVLRMNPGEQLDDALAARVVEQVSDGMHGLPRHHIAVREAGNPDYLFVGNLGRID